MMRPILFLCLFCAISSISFSQTNILLNIQHKFEKSNYVPGQIYMNNNNNSILIQDIQYYLSDIELIHDGSQSTTISNQHFFIDGEIANYNLGAVSNTIQDLEYVNFNLGIDPASNLTSPATYNSSHPLSKMDMYSTNEQSYIFIKINGLVDTDGDQIPDKPFEFRAAGDQLLRQVNTEVTTAPDNNTLKINLVANIANWLKEIDLEFIGLQENAGSENEKLCDNTTDFTVFSQVATTSVNTLVSPKNHIFIDSRLSFAPTIHYKFYTTEQLDMTITNLNGSYFIQRFNLDPDGNFYMSDDLASGLYIVIFTTPKGLRQSKRFVIRN